MRWDQLFGLIGAAIGYFLGCFIYQQFISSAQNWGDVLFLGTFMTCVHMLIWAVIQILQDKNR